LYCLDSSDYHACGRRGSRTLHRAQASFDMTVVGFDAIIRVASDAMPTAVTELTFLLQFSNRGRITAQSISRENVRCAVFRIRQGSLQETLRSFSIPSF
jgi:hypothetical protein